MWSVVLCLVAAMSACQSGPRNFENENDRLREEVIDLNTRVDQLETENQGLKTQLATAQNQDGANASPLPEGLVPPACVRIEMTKLSGGVDTDKDGLDDTLRVYLKTLDARDRFVQTLGVVDATVVAITPGEPAKTLAAMRIDPLEFDKAYRSGFTSTHYTLTLKLDTPAPKTASELTVRLKLTDLQTGAELEAESVVPYVAALPE
jgi:outer membrane murein-binding lipoprotein Lpp